MKTSKIALIANIICCFLATIANIFKIEALSLFSIPLIIPFLFFYYFIETPKINFLVCAVLLFYFVGDSIALMNFDNEIVYIIPPFFLSNIAFIILIFQRLEKFKYHIYNCLALAVIFILLLYFWFTVNQLFTFVQDSIQFKVAIYGVSLVVLAVLASYNIIWCVNISNLYLMISASCMILSNVFYIFFNFQNQLVVLDVIHFICQIFTYLFFVKYILAREQEQLITV
jgi:hypothetical protein